MKYVKFITPTNIYEHMIKYIITVLMAGVSAKLQFERRGVAGYFVTKVSTHI